MKKLISFFCFVFFSATVLACEPKDERKEESYLILCGQKEKLVVRTFGDNQKTYKKLVVFLHGDMSRGGTLDSYDQFFAKIAESYSDSETLFAHVVRPGYSYVLNGLKLTSSGNLYERTDNYTQENVAEMAEVIKKLKASISAEALIVIGHSGGSNSAALMAGMYPGMVDKYFLIACVCSHNSYTSNYLNIKRSPSPEALLPKVDKKTKLITITGDQDTLTPAELARNYVEKAKELGVDASFYSMKGGHNSLFNAIPPLVTILMF